MPPQGVAEAGQLWEAVRIIIVPRIARRRAIGTVSLRRPPQPAPPPCVNCHSAGGYLIFQLAFERGQLCQGTRRKLVIYGMAGASSPPPDHIFAADGGAAGTGADCYRACPNSPEFRRR